MGDEEKRKKKKKESLMDNAHSAFRCF